MDQLGPLQEVPQVAADTWRLYGETPQAVQYPIYEMAEGTPFKPRVLLQIDAQRCIEAYFDDETGDLEAAEPFLTSLNNPGWRITAVVPLRQLGVAHEAFRSCDVDLQAWWRDPHGEVRFSSSERA